jgi:acetyl esterase/lipase
MMNILAYILSGLSLLMSVLFLIKLPMPPPGFVLLIPKLTAGALSPYWAIMGAVGAIFGGISGAYWAIPMGIVGAGMMSWFVWRCAQDHNGFEKAFGASWSDQISPEQAKKMVQNRWTWFLRMKASPEPSWERDIPFWTIPGTDRQLLCDIWHPADGDVSGLALIFFHGAAWHISDKDFGTRPFFRHLVAQGHTVMDVSYRLCPEVNIYGMMEDVKHAIAWMKANASRYGVNPDKIVLGGGSTGCHLALLAAYAPQHPELTPADLADADLSACGVISYYGPTDLLAVYEYENQQSYVGRPPVPIGDPEYTPNSADLGRIDTLLGGHPHEVPHMYELASPVTHVNPGCPPTLLIQAEKDLLVPADAARALHKKLVKVGVPAINIILPWTDHVFDLLLPQLSPPAQSALYDVDRFLALLLNKDHEPKRGEFTSLVTSDAVSGP